MFKNTFLSIYALFLLVLMTCTSVRVAAQETTTPVSAVPSYWHANSPAALPQTDVVPLPTTTITFEALRHDFGKMKIGSIGTYVFKFTNTGTEPLQITNAKGSCGCTIPKFPTGLIAPGESGEITVEFKPKAAGKVSKSVTITANTESRITTLFVSADVVEELSKKTEKNKNKIKKASFGLLLLPFLPKLLLYLDSRRNSHNGL